MTICAPQGTRSPLPARAMASIRVSGRWPLRASPGRPGGAKWLASTARIFCKLARCASTPYSGESARSPSNFAGSYRGLADRGLRGAEVPALAQQCHAGQQQCLPARQCSERAGGAARGPVRVDQSHSGPGHRGGQPGDPHRRGRELADRPPARPRFGEDRRRGPRPGPVRGPAGRAAAGAVQRRWRRRNRRDQPSQGPARADRQGRAAGRAAGAPGRAVRHQRRPAEPSPAARGTRSRACQ